MAPAWAPDGRLLAFVSDRTGKRQIYVISPEGEARALTDLEEGVGTFEWSPDGSRVAFTMTDAKSDARKEREEKYGEFEIVDQDYRVTHLHLVDVAGAGSGPAHPRRLTDGAFTVGAFRWSPDGRAIAFDHRRDPNLANGDTADISVVSVDGGEIRPVVRQDGPDTNPGLNKPKAARAAMEQNLEWFDQYVFQGTPPKGTAAGHPEP